MKFGLIIGALVMCTAALAQFSDNFESESGSATGTLLTNGFGGGGQNGWYLPVAGSLDGSVFTYTGNTLGKVGNATGGNQFAGAASAGAAPYRMQHGLALSNSGTWTLQSVFGLIFLCFHFFRCSCWNSE